MLSTKEANFYLFLVQNENEWIYSFLSEKQIEHSKWFTFDFLVTKLFHVPNDF